MSGSLTDPQACLQRMQANAPLLAHAKGMVIYMTEYRKTLKSLLMQKSAAKTVQMKECDAYAHPDYVQHLEALRVAVEEHERMRWEMVTDAAAVEVWRSTEASNRGMDRGTR
jgi:2-C-methyl-D-erythritol 4-phosphate cytidylyltransferase